MAMQPPMLTLSLDQPEVWAGGTLQVDVTIAHGGPAPEDYVLSLRGVDPAWVTLRPPTVSVEPGGQGYATVLIAPPADAASAELVLTVRAFAQMSNMIIEATQVALLYGASGAPPLPAAPLVAEQPGLRPSAMWALAGGFALLVLVVGVLVFFAIRSNRTSVASAACVAKPLKVVDLYSDDVTTAIRISDPDLSNMRVLRTEPSETLSPLFSSLVSLSPDGSRLAYVTASDEALDGAHVWSLDVGNPSQRQELASVPKGMWVVRPAWSADSKQIAFVRYNDQQAAAGQSQLELWVSEVGGQPRKVSSPAELRPEGFYGDVSQPLCWAQDNRSILFSSVTPAAASQGTRSGGTARPVASAPAGPRQVAVDVLTGSTENISASASSPIAGGQSPTGGSGAGGVCGLPPFSQNDPTWRNVVMQSSGDTIGKYGCAITATAMALNYYGAILTPPQLSTCLADHADQIGWSSVAGCANGAVTGSNAFEFSWPGLDQTLAAGDPAIVGMVRGQTGMHFVVVTSGGGGDANDYTVMDPWDGSTSKTLQTFVTSGYNPRWIRTFAGPDKSCPRLVGTQTPAADGTGIFVPTDGPLLVPAQLLPLFTKVAGQTGVPREILLAMARVESDFTPRAMGQPVASNSGSEDERALGMMQFLPSTYRTFSANVDAATGRQLGDAGVWDPEASIWAAAFFLQAHGVAADPRTALSAFTNAPWYPDIVQRVAAQYRATIIPDDTIYDASGTNKPGTVAWPNPLAPVAGAPGSGSAAASGLPQSGTFGNAGGATTASGLPVGGTAASGSATTAQGAGRAPIVWSVPEGGVSRREVHLDLNTKDDIGEIVKFTLYTLTQSGTPTAIINQPILSRSVTPGAVIQDDGVYEAVLVTQQGNAVRVSRRKFTIDRTPPRLDLSVSNGLPTPGAPGSAGTSVTGSATTAASSVTTANLSQPSTVGLTRLKIGYSDALSGVAAIEYQLDNSGWQLYFSDNSFKPELFVTTPGNHTVRMRATDLAGNVSTERALDFSVSAQPRASAATGTSAAPFVPTLLSPTPLPALGTPGAAGSAAALLQTSTGGTPVPSATVPLSAIIATPPGGAPAGAAPGGAAPGGAPGAAGAPGGAAGAPGAAPGAPGAIPIVNGNTTVAGAGPAGAAGTAGAGTAGAAGAGTPGGSTTGSGTVSVVSSAGAGTPGGTSGTAGASGTTTGTTTGTAAGTATTAVASATASPTPAPMVHIDPPSCPDVIVGATDTCSLVTVTNTGAAALTISKAEVTGDFAIGDWKSSCGSRLSAGGTCQIVVTFSPTASGSRVGRLTVTDNATDSPQSAPVSGRGIAQSTAVPTATPIPVPAIKVDQVTCPDTLTGATSQCSLTTVTNTSSAAVSITGFAATGEFAVANNSCAAPLAPGAPCQLVIAFKPTDTGARVGSLTVTYGGVGSPQTVPLHGSGVAPVVSLTPATLACPDTHVGQTATCQALLANTGTAVLTITSVTLASNSTVFSIPANACGSSLSAGASCQIPVTFSPLINGTYSATVTVNDNAAGTPHLVQVTGNGTGGTPVLTFAPSPIPCGSVTGGVAAPCSPVTVTNTGTAALTNLTVTIATTSPVGQNAFSQTNTCGATLNIGASCQVAVTFTPAADIIVPAATTYSGSLTFAGNPSFTQTATITGTSK